MDENLAERLQLDPAGPGLEERWRALLGYAVRVTMAPARCSRADIDALRAAGLRDEEIVDGVQVAAYFNYINRIADALGVDLEPGMRAP
ncbi:MAG: carboxymuconolactone decarboxylase family protein [Planctomycetes bacterium]|nr:carboxymuconolactone decarboxylase family protein [Planctomycetota bacterium]